MCRALLSEELDLIVQFACFFLLFLSSHSREQVRRLFFQNIGVIGGWIVYPSLPYPSTKTLKIVKMNGLISVLYECTDARSGHLCSFGKLHESL